MAISPNGLCLCGCGEQTDLWTVNNKRLGRVIGQHKAFVRGHERPIAPDGLGIKYADTKWCPRCDRRLPQTDFHNHAYCQHCSRAYQRERYWEDPLVRETRLTRSRRAAKFRDPATRREQRLRWRAQMTEEQRERMRELQRERNARHQARRAAELAEREAEDKLMRKDPLCLRLADPAGIALLDEMIERYGSATTLEHKMGVSVGFLNRYRSERYMPFDVVDYLLAQIGESYRLDEFEFRRRSEWNQIHGPAPVNQRRSVRRKTNAA